MGFLRMLMQPIRVGMMLSAIMAATATAFPLSLPNCNDSCGDVKIPYPFGKTEDCYLNDDAISGYYIINCTTSVDGQIQPMIGDFNVASISIEEGEIEVQTYNSLDCYNKSGAPLKNNSPTLTLSTFTVSATKNKFVAVGCDTYAYLNGDLNDQPFSIGCLSECQNISNVLNGTCSGIGCCEMKIPEGLKNVNYTAYSFYKNHTEVWDLIHAVLPLLSKKASSVSPQIILPVYNTIEPFRWFSSGQLVTRHVKLLRTKGITYVERIPNVLISTTGLGTVASAMTVTKETHTSNRVAKTLTSVMLTKNSITAQAINIA